MHYPLSSADPRIRPLPYPFKGLLTVSNDAEFLKFSFFDEFMKFLNSTRATRFGQGLGLRMSSSCFFYSRPDYNDPYFENLSPQSKPSAVAPRFRDFLQAEYFDTNHAFGDFDFGGGFHRAHAENVYSELDKVGARLPAWSNHGSQDNIQNIGRDAGYHQGDQIDSPAYHADLLPKNGVRYAWTDSKTYKVEDFPDASPAPIAPVARERKISALKSWTRSRATSVPQVPVRSEDRKHALILESTTLQDENPIQTFNRFRSTGRVAPNLSSLGFQIDQIDWTKFYANRCATVLYQHLGVLNKGAEGFTLSTAEQVLARPHVFLRPFYVLKNENEAGRLLVLRTGEFLEYLEAVGKCRVVESTAGIIDLIIADSTVFPYGVTVYYSGLPPKTVRFLGEPVEFDYNGPDETGEYSVSLKLKAQQDIW